MTLKELKKWKCRAEKCVEIYKNNGKDTSTAKVTIPADKFLDLTDTAIKALEQEPCEDAVSRQAVLDTLDKMDKALDTDRTVENYKELLNECYKVLPSVTPKEKSEYEHDHEVVKAYNDGQVYILDKIRAEIEEMKLDVDLDIGNEMIYNNAIKDVLEIIDKYRGDTDGKDSN